MGSLAVVFDTNVLVSAIGFGGTPLDALLRAVTIDDVDVVVSEATLDELDRVMRYDRLPFTETDRRRFLTILSHEAGQVAPEVSIDAVQRDPDDNVFLECAVAGDAAYVVSGDEHLRELGAFGDVAIVSPREFLDRLDRHTESS